MTNFKVLKDIRNEPVLINVQNITCVQQEDENECRVYFTGSDDDSMRVLGTLEEVTFSLAGKHLI